MINAAACPDCKNSLARFMGGPPVITAFSANGRGVTEIVPGDDVTVVWSVEGTDQVNIISLGSVLPSIPGPHPAAGSAQVENIQLADGTVAGWRLTASNRCGTVTQTVQVVIRGRKAVALGGGGARAAFEVGAVRCLQDVAGVRPEIYTGTSFGAFNAAKLAEGGLALNGLETLWRGLQHASDVYTEPWWFNQLEPIIKQIFRSSSSSFVFELAGMAFSYATNKILGALASAMGIPGWVYTIVTSFYPVVTGIVKAANYISAGRQALGAVSLFSPAPFEQLVNATIDPAKVAASGRELRVVAVPLETGRARVINQQGIMVGSGWRVSLRDAIRASTAIPIAFPPVPLQGPQGTEQYVDGGTRENIPVAAAVDAGAHRVFAILPAPSEVSSTQAFNFGGTISPANSPMIKIAARCVEVFLHEAQTNDVEPFGGFGVPVSVIAPSFNVHDTLFFNSGLISINMDYGYMCAFDEVVADPARRLQLHMSSNAITALRIDIWAGEHFANGESLPWQVRSQLRRTPNSLNMQTVRDLKRQLRSLVLKRIADSSQQSVPTHRADWWQKWERHPWTPYATSPWDRWGPWRDGELPAETVPPAN
jgi:predicted acylesterase/phospholipase RssA